MGIDAGLATATTSATPLAADAYEITIHTRSAAWLAPLYPIEDRLTTRWAPTTGPISAETHFREGRFQQDNAIAFGSLIVVQCSQFIDGAWQDRSLTVGSTLGVEDAIGALWRLREAATPDDVSFPVFTGSRVLQLHAVCTPDGAHRRCEVAVGKAANDASGDLRNTLTVWFTDDAVRLPVRARIETRAGGVAVTLLTPASVQRAGQH